MEAPLPMDIETSAAIDTLRNDIRGVESSLRAHTSLLFESLRDDMRMIAEGVIAVSARVASMDSKLSAVDTRVGSLNVKVSVLDTKVGSLDTKVDALGPSLDSR